MNTFQRIIDQIRQYRQEGEYLEHYLANCVYTLFNWEDGIVDYQLIAHKNRLIIHSFARLMNTSVPL